MDMKHLGESATYEDAWRADDEAKPATEAPAPDEFDKAGEPEVQPAGKQDSGAETAPVPDAKVEAHDEYAAGFGMDLPKSDAPAAAKREPQSFAEAFNHYRKAGAATFDWQGKKYSTKLASDKPATKVAAKPAAPKAASVTDTGDEMARMAARAPKGEAKAEAPKPAGSLKDRLREPNPSINDIPALARGAAESVKGADAAMKERVRGSTGANDIPAKVVNAVKNAPADAEAAGGWNNWMSDLTGLPRGAGAPKVAKN